MTSVITCVNSVMVEF